MYQNLAVLAAFALLYSLVARRLDKTPVNGAFVYLLFGVVAGPVGLGWMDLAIEEEGIRLVAELTLGLVLFIDAANADLSVLRQAYRLPARLLLVGLPLTILLGIGVGVLLFPGLGLLEIAILATMLAPTDAALGKAVVSNPAVPQRVREGLNVESGLNDGICVPILFTLLALAGASDHSGTTAGIALTLLAEEVGIGAAIGVGFAFVASRALREARERGWLDEPWMGIPVVAVAFASFCAAQAAGGSGFIACFLGGLCFGILTPKHKHAVLEGAEGLSEVFSLVTWVVFGGAVVLQHSGTVDWRVVVYALLSLTVVRMLPVYVSLTGLATGPDGKLFVGWFGPRGLASIVFLVIVIQEKLPGSETLMGAVIATVTFSIIAHGLTANPLAGAYGKRAQAEGSGTG